MFEGKKELYELKQAHEEWKSFINNREAARLEAMGGGDDSELKAAIAQKKQQIAHAQAELAKMKADLYMNKGDYNKVAFDAEWSIRKRDLKTRLVKLIQEQLMEGKKGHALAQELGTKNLTMIYDAQHGLEAFKAEQDSKMEQYNWQWHRFTGTRRYALAAEPTKEVLGWAYVLMKGALDTEEEGKWCIWDYKTGALLAGSSEVYFSDSERNRRNRADTLAELLAGTYAGKVKLSNINEYFEEGENSDDTEV